MGSRLFGSARVVGGRAGDDVGDRSKRDGLGRRRLLGRRDKSEDDRVDPIRVVPEGNRAVAALHPNRNIYLRTTIIYIVVNLSKVFGIIRT